MGEKVENKVRKQGSGKGDDGIGDGIGDKSPCEAMAEFEHRN